MAVNVEDIRISALVNPTSKQRECIEATDKYRFVLYGGAAGGGKSYLLRWWCLRQLLKRYAETGIKGLMVGLFSLDYPTLQDRQISKIEKEFPSWLGQTKRTEKEGLCFFVKDEFGGGRIALRNLQDPNSYKSAEFCDIAIEELTENDYETFEDLVLFRLRTPGIERPCFLAATNPTGKGLQWVKALWPDSNFRSFPQLNNLAHEFGYIPALLQDNPFLGAGYEQSLQGLSTKKRKALLEGDWTIPEGQYFINFNEEQRKVRHAVMMEIIQPWWPRWISQDWGYKHASPVHWHTTGNVSPEQARLLGRDWDAPRKCVFTYREHVATLSETDTSEEQLGGILARKSVGEKIETWILSSDAFGKKTSQNTAAELLKSGAKSFPDPQPANMEPGSRVVGWRFMSNLISADTWFISDMCPEAIAAIPALEYDKDSGGEDILKTDHLYDDIGDCFVASTLIATEFGEIPIERVCVGDKVWTREGLRPVRHAWKSDENADVYEAGMSDGRTILCTLTHKFFARGRFIPLDELRYGDRLTVWNSYTFREENTANCLPDTSAPQGDSYTGTYGLRRMVASLRDGMSIIKTGIEQTILSITLRRCQQKSIWRTTPEVAKIQSTWLGCKMRQKLGTLRRLVENGIVSIREVIDSIVTGEIARNAGLNSVESLPQGFAQTNASRSGDVLKGWTTSRKPANNVVQTSRPTAMNRYASAEDGALQFIGVRYVGRAPVYDLEVEGAHEFYANGVLVHNCLRYGLIDKLGTKGVPVYVQRAEIASQFVEGGVIVEPTELALAMQRFNSEHRNRGRRRAKWSAR